jgi:radical SAM protein with 4Fe4S-binding SPASM domain
MKKKFAIRQSLSEFPLWKHLDKERALYSFEMELTSRCNLNCRHCYINLPAGDSTAAAKELAKGEIRRIGHEAIALGAFWVLLSGGEPLLRKDFFDIYLDLKKAGLLVSLFTNATMMSNEHVRIFKKFPPRSVEVTVYGVTPDTYEKITRVPGSYRAFRRGLELLARAGVPVTLKAMALRSNLHEIPEIIRFCRKHGDSYFRFDPFLQLRYDRDPERNREIVSERLTPDEVVELETSDNVRLEALKKNCGRLIRPEFTEESSNALFRCGVGQGGFCVSASGIFRFCPSLWHPQCIDDLRKGSLADAWHGLFGQVRAMTSDRKNFLENCRICPVINLCMWCPALAYLETGQLDVPVGDFCQLALARKKMLVNS